MKKHPLDFDTRKALCVHLGEAAGSEIADLVLRMAQRIEALERGKVDSIQVVPDGSPRVYIGDSKGVGIESH